MKFKSHILTMALVMALCGVSSTSARCITPFVQTEVLRLYENFTQANRTDELSDDFMHVLDCVQNNHLRNCDEDTLLHVARELQSHGYLQVTPPVSPEVRNLINRNRN